MGRYLIALVLLTSINFSVQKMLRDFKQKINYVMYASFVFSILSLSGCASSQKFFEELKKADRGQQNTYLTPTTNCNSYIYGNSISTTCD